VEANVFVGKFIDQTFHVSERVRVCVSLEIYWCLLGGRPSPVKSHCL